MHQKSRTVSTGRLFLLRPPHRIPFPAIVRCDILGFTSDLPTYLASNGLTIDKARFATEHVSTKNALASMSGAKAPAG